MGNQPIINALICSLNYPNAITIIRNPKFKNWGFFFMFSNEEVTLLGPELVCLNKTMLKQQLKRYINLILKKYNMGKINFLTIVN